jgi:NAD-dependent dihydropyrimidine dehydrogenase PreA subunit
VKEKDLAFHYVCTWDQGKEIAGSFDRYWVMNCGCREERGAKCARSRMDLCLMFREDIVGSEGSGKKEISKTELEDIFKEAKEKHLVTRPFRNDKDRTKTEGICFCCDCCCGYFQNPIENVCDKGDFIEKTQKEDCTDCGECVQVCYFGAKKMEDGELSIERDECYGCGLCVDVCPTECIQMISRS